MGELTDQIINFARIPPLCSYVVEEGRLLRIFLIHLGPKILNCLKAIVPKNNDFD
jgi:hypothetical protein